MGSPTIFRTTNPLDFTQVDGVYIDEQRPPGPIQGIANDVVCVVGEFERGPTGVITSIGSSAELAAIFGGLGPDAAGVFYRGALALLNKQFGRLRVIRVATAGQVTATDTLPDAGAVAVVRVDANSPGNWGNSITIEVAAASNGVGTSFDLIVRRNGVTVEQLRNLTMTGIANGAVIPCTSNYIVVTRIAAGAGRPANAAATSLLTGSDGTPADGDYVTALNPLYAPEASAIRWVFAAEKNTDTVNAALLLLATTTSTKIVVISGASGQTKAQALTDVVDYRSDRVVYVYPEVKTYVRDANGGLGALQTVSATSFAAAALAALPPGRNPAGVNSEQFLSGIRAITDAGLTRNDYISFRQGGIMALQFAAERERFGFRSGVLSTLDTAKSNIARRTMADYLQESIAAALVYYQNLPLTAENQLLIKAAIEDFLDLQISLGLLPSRADLKYGSLQYEPYLVDIVSGNTPSGLAQGLFVVLLKVRIFASMDFIVLRTEIGEGVEITQEDLASAA